MNIALYFGSFNPIHIGHLIVASHIYHHHHLDQVWFVVSPQNPHKPSKSLLNEYHRLHLVRLACEQAPFLRVSDVEFSLPKPSYTIETMAYLEEKYPQHQFSIIMGSDSYTNLPNWKNGDVIMKRYPLLVYPRPNHPVTEHPNHKIEFDKHHTSKHSTLPHLTVAKAPLLDISSTYIRSLLAQKKSIQFLVTPEVESEIQSNAYYQ